MISAKKMLSSGNTLTLLTTVDADGVHVSAEYEVPPSTDDKREVQDLITALFTDVLIRVEKELT